VVVHGVLDTCIHVNGVVCLYRMDALNEWCIIGGGPWNEEWSVVSLLTGEV
jgi:hypothetical protein